MQESFYKSGDVVEILNPEGQDWIPAKVVEELEGHDIRVVVGDNEQLDVPGMFVRQKTPAPGKHITIVSGPFEIYDVHIPTENANKDERGYFRTGIQCFARNSSKPEILFPFTIYLQQTEGGDIGTSVAFKSPKTADESLSEYRCRDGCPNELCGLEWFQNTMNMASSLAGSFALTLYEKHFHEGKGLQEALGLCAEALEETTKKVTLRTRQSVALEHLGLLP